MQVLAVLPITPPLVAVPEAYENLESPSHPVENRPCTCCAVMGLGPTLGGRGAGGMLIQATVRRTSVGNHDIKGSYNQVRNAPVQTTRDGAGPARAPPPGTLPSGEAFPTPNYRKGGWKQIAAIQKCSGSKRWFVRVQTLPHSPTLPSEAQCPGEPPRWAGTCAGTLAVFRGRKSRLGRKASQQGPDLGRGDEGRATQKQAKSGAWQEGAAQGPPHTHSALMAWVRENGQEEAVTRI